ncbi:thioredoxin family protein [Lacihabitans soyangensis]|uniref:Thioredoxin family protein n=1 Tax=Lacihabitans soyangensis TaxID=869394 RepID=A0AAE3H2N9_9BACT|nr:thioredoxin family protein [Lacihabitans soyangensis]MCP9762856.1 thioredoxin family protein [Lacihabitans soyangensis]
MKKLVAFLIITVTFVGLSSFKAIKAKPVGFSFYKGTYDNMIREAKKQRKPIILDFWAAWCAPCQKLDKETFSDKELGNYLSQNFIVYKVDIDTFDGMEIVDRFAVDVFPTMIVFDPKNGQIGKFKGFYPPGYLQKELEKIQAKHNLYPVSTQDGLAINR